MTTQTIDSLKTRIAELEAVEFAVETNSGTYSSVEAARKCGTGDPRHADYTVYETVCGKRRRVGCDTDRAPGYARHLKTSLSTKREELAALKRELSVTRRVVR